MTKLKRVMKRNFKILAVVLLMAAASCSFTTKKFEDPNKDKLLIDLITYVLNQGHYDAKEINDSFSANVYEDYLEGLDPSKRFFYKEDLIGRLDLEPSQSSSPFLEPNSLWFLR